jgi:hypothetical protein
MNYKNNFDVNIWVHVEHLENLAHGDFAELEWGWDINSLPSTIYWVSVTIPIDIFENLPKAAHNTRFHK